MVNTTTATRSKKLTCERLPLAIYREIVAHLRQIDGVNADLYEQRATEFDYLQSQVGGLWLEYSAEPKIESTINAILTYYAQKYGSWVTVA